MKVELTVDGRPWTVEVDLARGVVRWDGKDRPFKVLQQAPLKVELEVAGEKLVVEGWVAGVPTAPATAVVGGENYAVTAQRTGAAPSAPPAVRGPALAPSPPSSSETSAGGATAVLPPMPGKVVEVRVQDGDRVTKGQILLVLEAMKMRNEVASPVAGVVGNLSVGPGSNVRAREPMMSIHPDG